MLATEIDNRWQSDRILLRALRDRAIDEGNPENAIERYRDRKPGLFADPPRIATDNANVAPDLALLLKHAGDEARARRLVETALEWYEATQPEGVYGYIHGILRAELLAVLGDDDAAMASLLEAAKSGYRWQWRWTMASKNFDALRERPEFGQMLTQVADDFAAQLENLLASPHLGEFDLRERPRQ